MTAFLRKETRLVLPSLIPALLLVTASGWLVSPPDLALALFGAAAVFAALSPFGQEFGFGTFPGLLNQPVPRQQVWFAKTVLAAGSVALLTVVFRGTIVISGAKGGLDTFSVPVAMVAVCALAGALWTSLLFRGTAAAFLFTVLAPILLLVLSAIAVAIAPQQLDFEALALMLLAVYAALAVAGSRRLFLEAEDVSILELRTFLPARLWREETKDFPLRTSGTLSSRFVLLRKELQSYRMALWLACGLACVHGAFLVLRQFVNAPLLPFVGILDLPRHLWLLLPLTVGSLAVAEERKQGTLEAQLCLPSTRRRLFGTKLIVALLLGIFFGSLVPWGIEGAGFIAGRQGPAFRCALDAPLSWSLFSCPVAGFPHANGNIRSEREAEWRGTYFDHISDAAQAADEVEVRSKVFVAQIADTDETVSRDSWSRYVLNRFLVTSAIALAATLLALWTSSLSSQSLEAFGIAFMATPILGAAFLWTLRESEGAGFLIWKGPLLCLIGAPLIAFALVATAFRNYQTTRTGRRIWVRGLGVLAATLLASGASAAIVYPRPWERWMNLEPVHSSPRLTGTIAPKICSSGGRVVALLPDGRIWVSSFDSDALRDSLRWREADVRQQNGTLGKARTPIPQSGALLPGSDWRDIHCNGSLARSRVPVHGLLLNLYPAGVFALKADGEWATARWWTGLYDPPVLRLMGPQPEWWEYWGDFSHTPATSWMFDYPWLRTYFPSRRDLDLRKGVLTESVDRNRYSSISRYSDWIAAATTEFDFVALAADGTLCGWPSEPELLPRILARSRRPAWCLNVLDGEGAKP